LSLWTVSGLLRAAEQTQALELACKQTGAPDLVLCKRHLASLAGQARARR
jgi:DNA polymerase-3 subunit delta